ncbi:MAG: glycosyltransferase family 2 protein [Gorillibacterium sp.]|nr:glycosyltransferase family 2 protein [Gorillibacterium sp.]
MSQEETVTIRDLEKELQNKLASAAAIKASSSAEIIAVVSNHQVGTSVKGSKLRTKKIRVRRKPQIKVRRKPQIKVKKRALATAKAGKLRHVVARTNKPLVKLPKRGSKRRRIRAKPSSLSQAYRAGEKAGVQAFITSPLASNPYAQINRDYWQWATRSGIRPESRGYQLEATRFYAGYCKALGLAAIHEVPLPTEKSVAIILSATGSEMRVGEVLNQLQRLSPQEIVVVANGVDDETFAIIREHPAHPIIIHYDTAIGYDVGRAIGAKITVSDILLFVDSDIVIPAEKLVPFVHEIAKGGSLALNNISPYVGAFKRWDSVTIVKAFVNRTLGRGDLGANSLTAIPHAMSRSAVETVGYSSLAVPPLAQVQAIRAGLQVTAPSSIDVISTNRLRSINQGLSNPVEKLIAGDHMEALASVMALSGERIDYPDFMRNRLYGEAAP